MPATRPQDDTNTGSALPLERGERASINEDDFRQKFGEELRQVLDVRTWHTGRDLTQEYPRIEREVKESVEREGELQRQVREELFPQLFNPATSPAEGGVYKANMDALGVIHRGLFFNGGVEACDGTVQVYDTLPLTIYQIGVSLVSYRGDQGTWHQRLFRRDLREQGSNPVEEALQALAQRSRRAALNHASGADELGELGRRTVMEYAERAILTRRSQAVWRMGHGNPIPYELLTGAGILELMVAATGVLRELIESQRRFVFVASEPRELALLTIGQALPPLHYAVVYNLADRLRDWIHQRRFAVGVADQLQWDGERLSPAQWIPRFLDRVASQVVIGLYRATRAAPAHLFYAHAEHVHLAAHIALADSMFEEYSGFPMLIRLADHVCTNVFGGSLKYLTDNAYASAGVPWRYATERTTRNQ